MNFIKSNQIQNLTKVKRSNMKPEKPTGNKIFQCQRLNKTLMSFYTKVQKIY